MSGVLDIDLGFESALTRIERMDNVGVKVGILGSSGDHRVKGSGGPQTVAEVAAHHEFGAPEAKIPQRSFLRAGIDGAQGEIGTAIEELTTKVIDGKMTPEVAAARLGLLGVRVVQKKLIDGPFVALSEKTIKAKGSSRPLIDTGQMRRSITHEVVDDAQAVADQEGSV